MDCIYKALYSIACHSPIHAHTDCRVNHARRQPARLEQLGLGRCLPQGHCNTQLGGAGDRTSNLAVTSQPTLPPELIQLYVLLEDLINQGSKALQLGFVFV